MELTPEEIELFESRSLIFDEKIKDRKELRILVGLRKKIREEMILRSEKFR